MNNTTPALNATNLNKLQDNVEDAIQEVQDDANDLDTNKLDKTSVKTTYTESGTDTYSCDYVNNLQTYSTTEQRVGTWTNNKPIYRKVYTGNTPSSENSWTNLNQISNTINEITNFYGTIYETNGKYNNINFGEGSYYVHTAVNTTSHYIMMIQKGWSSLSYKIVIEYTKTTDV